MNSQRILIVDDEETVLDIYQLQLEERFAIDVAISGEAGLDRIATAEPYAVIVSDMNMPGMNGAEFLHLVQSRSPQSVRIMLTGDDKQAIAAEAVNEGQIFRFLKKPCPSRSLALAIDAALAQYQLHRAEKELLSSTLNGSVNLLVEILSIVNPLAFGRAARVKRLVVAMCAQAEVCQSWELTIAAMLSQVGCVSLSDSVLQKLHDNEPLTVSERRQFEAHPRLGRELVSKIPRLESIGDIIAAQLRPYRDGIDHPEDVDLLDRAAYLKVALEYDRLTQAGDRPLAALAELSRRSDEFAPHVVGILRAVLDANSDTRTAEVGLSQLAAGMILEADLTDGAGRVLVTRGQEITDWLLTRLNAMHERGRRICQPVLVSNTGKCCIGEKAGQPAIEIPIERSH